MKNAAVDQQAPSSASTSHSSSTSTASVDGQARAKRAGAASDKPAVSITLAGKEYRIRSDASEEWLQQVASHVDQALQNIRERTDTVDSLDIALLAALNLAREVLHLRGQVPAGAEAVSDVRLRDLIEQVEMELPATDSGRADS